MGTARERQMREQDPVSADFCALKKSNKHSEKFFTHFIIMWYTIACLNRFRKKE